MVKSVNKENGEFYQCEECDLLYRDKSWAQKCEGWCRENNSCNLNITKYAIKNLK